LRSYIFYGFQIGPTAAKRKLSSKKDDPSDVKSKGKDKQPKTQMIQTAGMRVISSAFTAYALPRFRRSASFKYINIYTAAFFVVAPAVVVTRSTVPDLWGLAITSTHWYCRGAALKCKGGLLLRVRIGTAGALHLNANPDVGM
jgi:hypothetical protein